MNASYLQDLKDTRARMDKQVELTESPVQKALLIGQSNGLDMAIRLYEAYEEM